MTKDQLKVKQYTSDFSSTLAQWGMKKVRFYQLSDNTPSPRSWDDAENPAVGVSVTLANKMKDIFDAVARKEKKKGSLTFHDVIPTKSNPSKK